MSGEVVLVPYCPVAAKPSLSHLKLGIMHVEGDGATWLPSSATLFSPSLSTWGPRHNGAKTKTSPLWHVQSNETANKIKWLFLPLSLARFLML